MKRILAMLVMVLVLLGSVATAEGIELASLNDEQLVALMERVQQEIVARHIEKTATMRRGSYIAGRDIPAGSYVYTCLATGDDWGNVTIRADEGNGDQLFWNIAFAPEEGEEPDGYFITLKDGDRLKSDVPFSLTVYVGLRFK